MDDAISQRTVAEGTLARARSYTGPCPKLYWPVAEIELALDRLSWPVAEGRYVGKAEHRRFLNLNSY